MANWTKEEIKLWVRQMEAHDTKVICLAEAEDYFAVAVDRDSGKQ